MMTSQLTTTWPLSSNGTPNSLSTKVTNCTSLVSLTLESTCLISPSESTPTTPYTPPTIASSSQTSLVLRSVMVSPTGSLTLMPLGSNKLSISASIPQSSAPKWLLPTVTIPAATCKALRPSAWATSHSSLATLPTLTFTTSTVSALETTPTLR